MNKVMSRKQTGKGPHFVRYFGPVLDALRHLGGSGTPDEVREALANDLELPDKTLNEQTASGQSRFDNQVAWARFYLVKAGLIDSSKRGVWSLTERGLKERLRDGEALQLFKAVHAGFGADDTPTKIIEPTESEQPSAEPSDDAPSRHHLELLSTLRSLTPKGFERFCMRLLREAGFQQVEVTGRANDGGIDGHGILQVNPLVTFRVLFQCKRYKDSVPPAQIRDFRGAMMGRADKGIFLTTGTFTREARKEAVRDGAPTIELVDAEKLMEMLESLELGVKPRTVYDVDTEFFKEYQ